MINFSYTTKKKINKNIIQIDYKFLISNATVDLENQMHYLI